MKKVYQSKTVWKAIIIGVAGVTVAVLTELDLLGYVMIVNAGLDIILRSITTEPIY